MRHRRIRGREAVRRRSWSAGLQAARVPRLRLGRRRGASAQRRASGRCAPRASSEPREARGRSEPLAGHHRHRPHPLGDARQPADENAHPHSYEGVAVVHNGIIENHLRAQGGAAAQAGHMFTSETDTEIFAHLIYDELKKRRWTCPPRCAPALAQVRGTYALVVISETRARTMLVAPKNASPLVLGLGAGRELRRLRRAGAPRAHARRDLPRRGRLRRHHRRAASS